MFAVKEQMRGFKCLGEGGGRAGEVEGGGRVG